MTSSLIMSKNIIYPIEPDKNRVSHLYSLEIIIACPHILIYSSINFELKDQRSRVNTHQEVEVEPKIGLAIDSNLALIPLLWNDAAVHFEGANKVYICKEH